MYNICTWPLTLYQLAIKSHEYFIGIVEYLPNSKNIDQNRLEIGRLFKI